MGTAFRKSAFTLFFLLSTGFILFCGEKRGQNRVLIMGDSHAFSLRESFPGGGEESWLADIKGISSSGLARRDYFDWIRFARSEESDGYDLYVVILGTNDGQNSSGSAREVFGTRDWEYLYTARVESLIAALREKGEVLWVSIPPVRDGELNRKTEYLQALIDEVCLFHGVRQLDICEHITGSLQKEDGIHLSAGGVKLAAEALRRELDDFF